MSDTIETVQRSHVITLGLRPPAPVTAVAVVSTVLDGAYPGSVARYNESGDLVIETPNNADHEFIDAFTEFCETWKKEHPS